MTEWISRARKFLASLALAAASALSAGYVPDQYVRYVTAALAILTAAGVYVVKNAPDPVAVDAAAEAKLNAAPNP